MIARRVLVADGDYAVLDKVGGQLAAHDCEVFLASSVEEMLDVAAANCCDAAFVDLGLSGRDGLEAAKTLTAISPDTLITMIGESADLTEHFAELAAARFTALRKPITGDAVLLVIERAAEIHRLRRENRMLQNQWEEDQGLDDFVSRSPQMIEALRQAATAAETAEPVILHGAPGTEKEIFALYIHRCSARADNLFVRFECGRMTGRLEEIELFGHERTGECGGRIELADGGTLFLDNVGRLSAACQARLLRLVEEGEVRHDRGAACGRHQCAGVRIICASVQDCRDAPGVQPFRQDLLYRLSGLSIAIPPLSARRMDILPLANRFLCRFSAEAGKPIRRISDEAAGRLLEYDWPGNVEELKHVIRCAATGARHDLLSPEDLPRVTRRPKSGIHGCTLQEAERQLILTALHETGGNYAEAARRLGLTPSSLAAKVAAYRRNGLFAASRRPEGATC